MPKWLHPLPILAAGAVAAAVSAFALSPLAAFVAAVLVMLLASVMSGRRDDVPEPQPAEPPSTLQGPVPAAVEPAEVAMPSAFGQALIEKLPTPLLVLSR